MEKKLFDDFVPAQRVRRKTLKRYRDFLPASLIEAWQQHGFGTMMGGYLKMVNPDEYLDALAQGYVRGGVSIPIFVTAFADVITWEEGRLVGFVNFRYKFYDSIGHDFDAFLEEVNTEAFAMAFFDLEGYDAAVKRWGPLPYDKCFCHVPLLAMGGSKSVENMDIGDAAVHLAIMTHLTGMVIDSDAEQG